MLDAIGHYSLLSLFDKAISEIVWGVVKYG